MCSNNYTEVYVLVSVYFTYYSKKIYLKENSKREGRNESH